MTSGMANPGTMERIRKILEERRKSHKTSELFTQDQIEEIKRKLGDDKRDVRSVYKLPIK